MKGKKEIEIFRLKSWWMMEETFEEEIRRLWEAASGSVMEKLGSLQVGLLSWSKSIRGKRRGLKMSLKKKLEELADKGSDNDTLADLIDTKFN